MKAISDRGHGAGEGVYWTLSVKLFYKNKTALKYITI